MSDQIFIRNNIIRPDEVVNRNGNPHPRATIITSCGRIHLNAAAARLLPSKCRRVTVNLDEVNLKIILTPTEITKKGVGFRLSHSGGSTNRRIAGRYLFTESTIKTQKTQNIMFDNGSLIISCRKK